MAKQTSHYIQAKSVADLKTAVNTYLTANITYRVVGAPIYDVGTGLWTQWLADQYAIV